MNITSISPQQLRQAADLKEQIDGLQDQLNAILGGEVSTPMASEPATKPGRKEEDDSCLEKSTLSCAKSKMGKGEGSREWDSADTKT